MRNSLSLAISLALLGPVLAAAPAFAHEGHEGHAPAAAARPLPTTQLPRTVRPAHYAVSITPHADKLAFDGHVAIDIEVLEPTTTIVLNQRDLQFRNVRLASRQPGARPQPRSPGAGAVVA